MSLRKWYYTLTPIWRMRVRRWVYAPVDLWQTLSRRRKGLEPPLGLIYTGSGDFREQGRRFLGHFQRYGGLEPHHRVLDVGSGIGRMAIPLTDYLDERGSYEGFDIVATGVRWCRKHITPLFPRFQFRHIPLHNDLYTTGGEDAAGFPFPYPDHDFDFVILTSVFTHLLPAQMEHYLREIRRVLRPGGRVFATFFLWTSDTRPPERFAFPFDFGHYRLMDRQVQSANVAYQLDYLLEQVQAAGLRVEAIHLGYWRGTPPKEAPDFQDIMILT